MREPTEQELERGRICRKPGLGRLTAPLAPKQAPPPAPKETPVIATIGFDEIVKLVDMSPGKIREGLMRAGVTPTVMGRPRHPAKYLRAPVLAWIEGRKARPARRQIDGDAVAAAIHAAAPRAPHVVLENRTDQVQMVAVSVINEKREDVVAVGGDGAILAALRVKLDLAEARVREAEAEAARWRTAIEAVEAVR